MAETVTSAGVLVDLVGAVLTGVLQMDAAIAALVALRVLRSGWEVIRDTASGLLDEAALAEELDTICSVTSANAEGALEIQALRRRHAGRMTSIDLHMVVLESITADDAHDICDRV